MRGERIKKADMFEHMWRRFNTIKKITERKVNLKIFNCEKQNDLGQHYKEVVYV